MRGAASRKLGLATAIALVAVAAFVVPAPAAPVTVTVPYSAAPVADGDLDGNPATGAWTDAGMWTIPLENGAASPYGSATLYAKHNGTFVFFRVDGKIDVSWTSSAGNHFWFGIAFSSSTMTHHSSWQDGVFFGEDAYTTAPPLVAVDTHGGGQPPASDTAQDDAGRMGVTGAAAPYSFTAEWKRKLNTGDAQDLAFIANGATSYYFYATSDSNGGGSRGGTVNHRATTNDNILRFATVPPADTTPPTVVITSPANNAVVNGIVTIAATATDNVGVTKVEFYADTTLLGTVTTSPYSQAWDTATYAQGTHQVSAKAFDAANNSAASTITVSVDHAARSLTITAPPNNSYLRGNVTINATATDPGGVARVDFYIDGAFLATDSASPYSANWDTSRSAEGLRVVGARANYTAGGSMNATIRVTVDRTPPVANAGPPRTVSAGTSVALDGSKSTDANGLANWTWAFEDQGPQRLYGVSPSYRFVHIGSVRVNLTVTDPAGNNATAATWVNVTARDTTPPERMPAPSVDTYGPGATFVLWNRSTASDLAGYLLRRALSADGPFIQLNEQPIANTTYVDEGLDPGARYYYEVVAVDVSGNPSPPSPAASGMAGAAPAAPLDWLSLRWALVPGATAVVLAGLGLLARREARKRPPPPTLDEGPQTPPEVGR